MKTSNAAIIAAINAIVGRLDAGAGSGVLEIYDGAQPADVSVAVTTQTLLSSNTLNDPAFAAAVDTTGSATATAAAISAAVAIAAGTATWFRALDSNGVAVIDGTAGLNSGELSLDDVTFIVNKNININSWTISMPE